MKANWAYFKTRLQMGLQYRTAALAGVGTQFFWGFMYLMIFKAFYDYSSQPQPMTFDELVQYLWMQQALLSLVMLWFRDNSLFELITTGNMAYELARPLNIYNFWYAKLIAQRASAASLRSMPILLVAFLLPEPFRMHLPEDPKAIIVFAISMLLGLLLVVCISMLIYILTFITLSPMGSLLLIGVSGEFFAGQIIPVPLMPLWLQQIVNCLPFRYVSDVPFRIYSGNIGLDQALFPLVGQVFWIVLLMAFGQWAMARVLKRTVIQGG